MDKLLKEQQAADILAVSVHTVRKWRADGKGPVYVKIGGSVRYRLADLQDYIHDALAGKPGK